MKSVLAVSLVGCCASAVLAGELPVAGKAPVANAFGQSTLASAISAVNTPAGFPVDGVAETGSGASLGLRAGLATGSTFSLSSVGGAGLPALTLPGGAAQQFAIAPASGLTLGNSESLGLGSLGNSHAEVGGGASGYIGIDNVIPLPSAAGMSLAGLALLGARRRRTLA